MSRHRKLRAIDPSEEYDDYYNCDELDDSFERCDLSDEVNSSDDEIEDFETRYLNTGIDLNLNPNQPPEQKIQSAGKSSIDGHSCSEQNVDASLEPSQESSSSIRVGVTPSESLLRPNLDNSNFDSTKEPISFHVDKTSCSIPPTESAVLQQIPDQYHQLNQVFSDTLSKLATQHLNEHQWKLPLLEMDSIFRDNTYFRHYNDSYVCNLQSKLGLFMSDLQLKKQSLKNQDKTRDLYIQDRMFGLLIDYYKSLQLGFFSFTTPSPDEEIAIGCRFGSKAKPLQPKKPNQKKGPEIASQQTRFEYGGAKVSQNKNENKDTAQASQASTSTSNQQTQNRKFQDKKLDKIDQTIRADFDASKIKQPAKVQDNKPFTVPESKANPKSKTVDLTSIKPHKFLANKSNPPKQLQSLVDKRKDKKRGASHKLTGPTKEDMESFKERSKENLKEYKRLMDNVKPSINLIVVGHVDAGKSTLVGHLLFKLGLVSNKLMHRYTTDSQRSGKASFKFAWILDETDEERSRGVTIDIASTRFETQNRDINLLDAPGHSDFIPSVITGATQADSAILVVDATRGEFETGFERGGQTREHTLLIRSLGVKSLLVAINKMDNVDWDEARFNHIVEQLKPFIKQVGYNVDKIRFVPCSGLSGSNLTTKFAPNKNSSHPQLENWNWYKGPSLLDCLDELEPPERAVDKPTRLCITDIFKGMSSGVFLGANIEGGYIQEKQKLLLMPQNETCEVKSIEVKDLKTKQAFAGDLITLVTTGIDLEKYYRGSILCDPSIPSYVTNRFQARIVTFDIDSILLKGSPVEIHMNGMTESGRIRKLVSLLNRSTGDLIQKRPRCIPKNSSAVIEIVATRVLCVELYENYQNLGRFLLRSMGKTTGAGLICKICRPKIDKSKMNHGKSNLVK